MRGEVVGQPESIVSAAQGVDGLTAMIHCGDRTTWIVEPIPMRLRQGRRSLHVSYRMQDRLPVGGKCGTANVPEAKPPEVQFAPAGAFVAPRFHYAKIAFDSEVEYYRGTVEGTMNAIEALLNSVDAIYTRDVQISYVLTAIVVRTTEPDPYHGDNATNLLEQFRTHWNANHTAIDRDVAHLLTGRDLDGSTIGIAHLGTICLRPAYSYGLSGNQSVCVAHIRSASQYHGA